MSQENVELVRSIAEAWERGDFGSAEWADPDIEFVVGDGPAPGRWEGLAGMAEGVRDWLSAWENLRFKAVDHRELDGERVLLFFDFRARGKASGLEIGEIAGARGAGVFHIRAGKVTRLEQYLDSDHALEAVGLRE